MTDERELKALIAASSLLDAKCREVCSEPLPVFIFVAHAKEYVNQLLDSYLREGNQQ